MSAETIVERFRRYEGALLSDGDTEAVEQRLAMRRSGRALGLTSVFEPRGWQVEPEPEPARSWWQRAKVWWRECWV